MSLSYALHQNKVSKKKNAYRALIKNRRKYTLEDIISRMAESHGGITKGEALSSMELFMSEVEAILMEGGVVSTPLFHAQCSISGEFDSFEDHFYPSRHEIKINLKPGARLKSVAKDIKAYKVKSNIPCPYIMDFTDMSSGKKNSLLKPGASAIIKGKLLQFDQTDPKQGVYFRGTDNSIHKVPEVYLNTFSQIYIVVPADLQAGIYRLEVRSNLKTQTLRSGELGYNLTVSS